MSSDARSAIHRYWLSWVQPTDDYRPLTDPPHAEVIGWWCSGETSSGHATLCALVASASMSDAKKAVRVSWPEAPGVRGNWRFDDERPDGWTPGDRFPLSDWMAIREQAQFSPAAVTAAERMEC